MSDPEQKAPRRRAIATLTSARERVPTRAGARERASRRAGARGRASVQAGARERTPVDPRVNGILQVLETLGNMVEQQAQNQATTTAAATDVAAVAAAAPAELPPRNRNGAWPMYKLVKHFLRLKPPKFTGAGDPEAAILWIQQLEKAFALLRCSEEDKVILAVYQLQGNASTWWKATKGRVFPEGMVPEWNAFVEVFYEKYFSDYAREQKMVEFQYLRQNQMSVDQYETKFAELSKYASKLIEDPIDRARRFRDGLKSEIKDLLVLDYDELYERAQLIERDLNERAVAFGSRFVPNRDNNRFGKRQQAQNQAAAVATVATDAVTTAAASTAAAPAEVPPRNGNGEWPMYKLVKHFLRLKPPKFTGADDLEAAILWIKQLEKAFALLRCSEEDKVILAVYQLQGNASTWWKATERRVFPEGMVLEWDAFVKVFYRKYFSECAREQKMVEFQRLRQNQMSVDQYEAKFSELSKYAPRLIEDPVDRARRFRDGLKPEIKDPLVPLNLKNYNELYKRAQLIERDLNERAAAFGSRFVPNKDNNWFGKRSMMGGNYPIPPNRNGGIGKPASNSNVVCQFCGWKHGSTSCLARMRACYGCGQHGHQVKNCPRKPMGVQTPLPQIGQATGGVSQNAHQGILSRPPMQGRVYAVTRREAENSQNVVTGS